MYMNVLCTHPSNKVLPKGVRVLSLILIFLSLGSFLILVCPNWNDQFVIFPLCFTLQNKKKKPRGTSNKADTEGRWVQQEKDVEDQQGFELRQSGGREMTGSWSQKPAHCQLAWRSSESEYSDTEGGINAKLR